MEDHSITKKKNRHRVLSIFLLVVAGESIFFLPFVIPRVFRPIYLEVFELTNFELGYIFSVYGIVALLSYLVGGPLADIFSVKKLMFTALVLTSMGGLLLATFPAKLVLMLLYGFWGLTTILLFWSALIRATRIAGGEGKQGSAFGWLDGGRGFMSAMLGSVLVYALALFITSEISEATLADKQQAMQKMILMTSAFVLLVGAAIWMFWDDRPNEIKGRKYLDGEEIKKLLTKPTIWAQALIILCAYSAYKSTDDFSLFASDVMGFDDIDAAKTGTISLWVRPIAAIFLGLLADRFSASKMTICSFVLLILGSIVLATGYISPSVPIFFFFILIVTSIGIYALRGLYFAIMEEGKIPLVYMGSAVGLVSLLGYTPDIFFGPLMGYLLDTSPGPTGHQHVFVMVTLFGSLGLLATLWYRHLSKDVNNPRALGMK